MFSKMQRALIEKDMVYFLSNKRLTAVLFIVPAVMTIFLPSVFMLITLLTPQASADFQELLRLLPVGLMQGDTRISLVKFLLDNILPVFFLILPIMASSVMAASSFVGEKEKRTLETLFYSPLTIGQIFAAKIVASFIVSMLVSAFSFLAMIIVVEAEVWFLAKTFVMPGLSWPIVIFLLAPALSFISIIITIRGSAKAQTVEESQQRSALLVLPIVLLAAGQFTGLMMLNPLILLMVSVVVIAIAYITLGAASRGFKYETLLL